MGYQPRVRPGLSSPDQSQDVEFTIDKQIDDGQHERDEKDGGGTMGPPQTAKRFKPNRTGPDGHEQQEASDHEKK